MRINLTIISDSNLELLKRCIESRNNKFIKKVFISPYGQLYQSIYGFKEDLNNVIFINSFPETHLEEFKKALNSEKVNKVKLIKEVKEYSELLISLSKKCKCILIPSWSILYHYKSFGVLDWKSDFGISNLLNEINSALNLYTKDSKNIYIIDSSGWLLNDVNSRNSKMWYLSKVPYHQKTLEKITFSIISSINTICGVSKKLIIVDLDNTLWGGVIGDLDYYNIKIGGHDYIGEAYADFQKALLALQKQGVLLAISSKNEEDIAMRAFDLNKSMILRKEHFVHWEINWNDKASNILKIVKELNIGLDSVVFIDDNPVERDLVSKTLPEVYVPDWSIEPTLFSLELNKMRCFDQVIFTADDKIRNETYLENKERNNSQARSYNKEEWLKQLDTTIELNNLNDNNLPRIAQLFSKTNQFNLSTRRLTELEIKDIYSKRDFCLISINVKDKFGDLGLVGIIGLKIYKNKILVKDLILSCRAMGRGIEDTMLFLTKETCISNQIDYFELEYKETSKNLPLFNYLKESKLEIKKNNLFFSKVNQVFKKPSYIKINSKIK